MARTDFVATLHPGYFALVMATGIVSIAMHNHGLATISAILLWLAAFEYAVLVALFIWRMIAYRSGVAADVRDPVRAFGFFTIVAGTDVLGTRLVLADHQTTAFGLLAAGCLAWLILGYVIPWAVGVGAESALRRANGAWFIWAVASQSIAALSAALQPTVHNGRDVLALLAVFSWSVGVFLYAAVGTLVAVRIVRYPFGPGDLTPPYWVAMGATAITIVAGARILRITGSPAVSATRDTVTAASVVFWSFGTWLIPPLIAAGIWRHAIRRVPLRYDPTMWSVVFPLGMYGVASHDLGRNVHLSVINSIGSNESWAALAAWIVTFLAMLRHIWRRRQTAPPA